jgi:tetratricopeptide (TPR) repeat protein
MAKPLKELSIPPKVGSAHPAVKDLNDYAASGLAAKRHYQAAIIAGKRAIRVAPNAKELWSNVGTYFFNLREYAQAELCLLRAISLDPNYATALCNLALVYSAAREYGKADEYFEKAHKANPEYLATVWDRSLSKLRRGDYASGFEDYEIRIPFKPKSYPPFPAPYYDGGPLEGKSIYIIGEQGIGDTIMFSRFLPWLHEQGARVLLCVNPQMIRLLWEFNDVLQFLPEGVPIPRTDYSMAMGSLPYWYSKLTGKLNVADDLPPDPGLIRRRAVEYMTQEKVELPTPQTPEPFKIGIAWTGNPEMDRNEERSIPLTQIARLAEDPRAWLYSFQCGPGASDIANTGCDQMVCDLSPLLMSKGLCATAAAMMQMDLVVTCCTMVAHLAGALGIPTWVLLCYDAYWPWLLDRNDSPWYPSVKLFRQVVPDNWVWVMNDVVKELDVLISQKARN